MGFKSGSRITHRFRSGSWWRKSDAEMIMGGRRREKHRPQREESPRNALMKPEEGQRARVETVT